MTTESARQTADDEYRPCPRHGTRCLREIPGLRARIECAIGLCYTPGTGPEGVEATAERIMMMIEDERAALPEGLYENWAVGYRNPWGEQEHTQYGDEDDARANLGRRRGEVLQCRWQTDWATVYPDREQGSGK